MSSPSLSLSSRAVPVKNRGRRPFPAFAGELSPSSMEDHRVSHCSGGRNPPHPPTAIRLPTDGSDYIGLKPIPLWSTVDCGHCPQIHVSRFTVSHPTPRYHVASTWTITKSTRWPLHFCKKTPRLSQNRTRRPWFVLKSNFFILI